MEKFSFDKRLKSMLKLDLRRLFTLPLLYIVVGSCIVVLILIFVMVSMMEGSPITDQYGNAILDELGNPVLMEGFKNVWQMLGTVSGSEMGMSMDITSMCNINMMYFATAILICLFIGQDFRSGYCKNLFTVRSNKVDYVISKTLVGFIGGGLFSLGLGAISNIVLKKTNLI